MLWMTFSVNVRCGPIIPDDVVDGVPISVSFSIGQAGSCDA